MRPYTVKPNKHVIYFTATGRAKPGTITGGSGSTPTIRIARTGTVFTAVPRDVGGPRSNVWAPA